MTARRALLFALVLVSGFSAIVYQFVWIRLLGQIVGGSGPAISIVLAVFMGGLALGSRFFGQRADRATSPLLLYARLELGIAALGALVPPLAAALTPAYVAVARSGPDALLFLARLLFSTVLLLPAVFLMGGTLPAVVRFFVRSDDRVGRGVGALYAVNTFGAVVGSLAAGFFLIRHAGLQGSVWTAVCGNLVVAIGAWGVARRERGAASPGAAPPARAEPPRTARPSLEIAGAALAVMFAASGFAALGLEIAWTRSLQLFLGNSTFAYATMLTTFLLGLSLGGRLGGPLADRVASPASWLGGVQLGIGVMTALTLPLIWLWLPALDEAGWFAERGVSWGGYLLRRFAASSAVMLPPTLLFGMVFPLVNRIGVASRSRLGAGLGGLYFANTLGAIAGSLAAGFVLLPWLGARGVVATSAVISLAVAVAVLSLVRPARARRAAVSALAAVAVAVAAFAFVGRPVGILSDSQTRRDTVLFEEEDATAVTRVYRKPSGEMHMSVDGHHIGGTNANILRKEKILAHLPLFLVPRAERVLAIGLGTGITLGAFALHPEVTSLTCAEIAPSVVDGAARFAGPNRAVLENPIADVHVEDGIQFLRLHDMKYDVISSDSKLNPDYVGNAALLAREYYALCRGHLAEDGVFVQWLPAHVPLSEVRLVARSLMDVYPWVGLFWHEATSLVLVAAEKEIAVDRDRVAAVLADGAVRKDVDALDLADPYLLASMTFLNHPELERAVGPGPVNSWARPRLEFTMIRAGFGKAQAVLEHETLQWVLRHRSAKGVPLRGSWDGERLARFRTSGGKLLEGYAAEGATAFPAAGTARFREGIAINPEDSRLARVIRYLDRAR